MFGEAGEKKVEVSMTYSVPRRVKHAFDGSTCCASYAGGEVGDAGHNARGLLLCCFGEVFGGCLDLLTVFPMSEVHGHM